jgi:hypothetical protein
MPRIVDMYNNRSLTELEFRAGELVLLDGGVDDVSPPLVLGHLNRIEEGVLSEGGLGLLFLPDGASKESMEIRNAYFDGNVIGLYSPHFVNGRKVAHDIPLCKIPNPYFVETAVAGREEIIEYLKKCDAFYAGCLRDGRLVTERGILGKLAEKLGIRSDRIRFRG